MGQNSKKINLNARLFKTEFNFLLYTLLVLEIHRKPILSSCWVKLGILHERKTTFAIKPIKSCRMCLVTF